MKHGLIKHARNQYCEKSVHQQDVSSKGLITGFKNSRDVYRLLQFTKKSHPNTYQQKMKWAQIFGVVKKALQHVIHSFVYRQMLKKTRYFYHLCKSFSMHMKKQ